MKTNKKTIKKTNAKKAAVKKCCLCGVEIEGHGNNPNPLAAEGVCCDKCNAEKVIPARAAETKAAAKKAYALEYYKKNAEKIRESSKKSHARRREAERIAAQVVSMIYDAVSGVVSEHGPEFFDAFYRAGGEQMMADFEHAVLTFKKGAK